LYADQVIFDPSFYFLVQPELELSVVLTYLASAACSMACLWLYPPDFGLSSRHIMGSMDFKSLSITCRRGGCDV
jgi:hypothetical protein